MGRQRLLGDVVKLLVSFVKRALSLFKSSSRHRGSHSPLGNSILRKSWHHQAKISLESNQNFIIAGSNYARFKDGWGLHLWVGGIGWPCGFAASSPRAGLSGRAHQCAQFGRRKLSGSGDVDCDRERTLAKVGPTDRK